MNPWSFFQNPGGLSGLGSRFQQFQQFGRQSPWQNSPWAQYQKTDPFGQGMPNTRQAAPANVTLPFNPNGGMQMSAPPPNPLGVGTPLQANPNAGMTMTAPLPTGTGTALSNNPNTGMALSAPSPTQATQLPQATAQAGGQGLMGKGQYPLAGMTTRG